ncbi:MAG: peptidylprolyl isomerase [Burkholderiales bacterium]
MPRGFLGRLPHEQIRGTTMRWWMMCLLSGWAMQVAGQAARPPIVPIDRIVAIVNNEVITRSELDDRIRLVLQQLRQQKVEPPPADVLERQVLERMIGDRAQVQFAKESGLRIDDQQLDKAVERIAESNRLSIAEFRRTLDRDGVPFEKLREDVRIEMTVQRLREREVDSRIQVGESEIDNYLADGASSTSTLTEFNLSHVLVRVPEGASGDQLERLQSRARSALDELRGGAEFAKVAVAFSDAPDGLEGGSMGWRLRDRLPELFADVVDRMKPGDISDILRSPAGFHIVKLVERRGVKSEGRPLEQTRARHILVRANESVSETEARRRIDRLRQRLVDGATFEEIARFNSEDASAARGGDLGWVYPGDTVPEFENAMAQLKPNELSAPIRSPFGWHLIQVLERRTGELSSDRVRMEARKVLRDRKADEAYEEWLRQLRDRAYVEYRLDDR